MSETIIPDSLIKIKELVFDPLCFKLSNMVSETESKDYTACRFELDQLKIVFRSAKITPTKTGQFVTLWKRVADGPIQPFDCTDEIDLFIINVRTDHNFGQFVFPKSVLCQKGIISTDLKDGKRAIRVYPPWDKTINIQAQKNQKWQLDYFLEISSNHPINLNRAKMLYSR